MRVLILGSDGYLGWSTALSLLNDIDELILVDNYSKRKYMKKLNRTPLVNLARFSKRIKNIKSKAKKIIYETDCSIYENISKILRKHKPDAVIHFAELPSAPFSMLNKEYSWETIRNNLESTFNVVHAVKEIIPNAHIIKLGTMGEYGTPNIDIEEGWIDIKHNKRREKFLYPRQGSSLYHTSKIMDTDLIWFYTRMYNLRCTDLMQGPVYGIYPQSVINDKHVPIFTYDDIFGTVLNRFIVQSLINNPLTIYGSGKQIRGYINIKDSVECIKITLQNKPKKGTLNIYNQFTEQFSVLQLAEIVRNSMSEIGINVKIRKIKNPRVENENHYYNAKHSNLKNLGLKPTKLTNKIIIEIAQYCMKHKRNIRRDIISPKVSWK
tara:strand:- start:2842 stop:3981 length:1140 start_codon:yes stop_codon:yes gene_type:complete